MKIQLNNNKLSCCYGLYNYKFIMERERLFYEYCCCHDFRFFLHPRSGNDTKMADTLADKGDLNE